MVKMMRTYQKGFIYFWFPVLCYAGLIFALSSFPFSFPPALRIRFADKVIHVVEYGILGFLLARAFLKASPPFFRNSFQAWAVVVAICYGFSDEIHQFYVPMRRSSPVDLLFDGIGAFLAQFFFERRMF